MQSDSSGVSEAVADAPTTEVIEVPHGAGPFELVILLGAPVADR